MDDKVYYIAAKTEKTDYGFNPVKPATEYCSVALVTKATADKLVELDKKIDSLEKKLKPLSDAMLNAKGFKERETASRNYEGSPDHQALRQLYKERTALLPPVMTATFQAPAGTYKDHAVLPRAEVESKPTFALNQAPQGLKGKY